GGTFRGHSVQAALPWAEPFDLLAIAVGAENATFGVPGVREHACFLKELADARRIRERVLGCLERAALPAVGDEERRRLLHFVAVGAGAARGRVAPPAGCPLAPHPSPRAPPQGGPGLGGSLGAGRGRAP